VLVSGVLRWPAIMSLILPGGKTCTTITDIA
jgi:hypothetical protein